eukprot:g3979.t1
MVEVNMPPVLTPLEVSITRNIKKARGILQEKFKNIPKEAEKLLVFDQYLKQPNVIQSSVHLREVSTFSTIVDLKRSQITLSTAKRVVNIVYRSCFRAQCKLLGRFVRINGHPLDVNKVKSPSTIPQIDRPNNRNGYRKSGTHWKVFYSKGETWRFSVGDRVHYGMSSCGVIQNIDYDNNTIIVSSEYSDPTTISSENIWKLPEAEYPSAYCQVFDCLKTMILQLRLFFSQQVCHGVLIKSGNTYHFPKGEQFDRFIIPKVKNLLISDFCNDTRYQEAKLVTNIDVKVHPQLDVCKTREKMTFALEELRTHFETEFNNVNPLMLRNIDCEGLSVAPSCDNCTDIGVRLKERKVQSIRYSGALLSVASYFATKYPSSYKQLSQFLKLPTKRHLDSHYRRPSGTTGFDNAFVEGVVEDLVLHKKFKKGKRPQLIMSFDATDITGALQFDGNQKIWGFPDIDDLNTMLTDTRVHKFAKHFFVIKVDYPTVGSRLDRVIGQYCLYKENSEITFECVQRCINALHRHGIDVIAQVSDGGSWNRKYYDLLFSLFQPIPAFEVLGHDVFRNWLNNWGNRTLKDFKVCNRYVGYRDPDNDSFNACLNDTPHMGKCTRNALQDSHQEPKNPQSRAMTWFPDEDSIKEYETIPPFNLRWKCLEDFAAHHLPNAEDFRGDDCFKLKFESIFDVGGASKMRVNLMANVLANRHLNAAFEQWLRDKDLQEDVSPIIRDERKACLQLKRAVKDMTKAIKGNYGHEYSQIGLRTTLRVNQDTKRKQIGASKLCPAEDIIFVIFQALLAKLDKQKERKHITEGVPRVLTAGFFELADEVSDVVLAGLFFSEGKEQAGLIMLTLIVLNRSCQAFVSFAMGETWQRVIEGFIGVKCLADTYRIVRDGPNVVVDTKGTLPILIINCAIWNALRYYFQDACLRDELWDMPHHASDAVKVPELFGDSDTCHGVHVILYRECFLPWDKVEKWLIEKKSAFSESPPIWMTVDWFDHLPSEVRERVWKNPKELEELKEKIDELSNPSDYALRASRKIQSYLRNNLDAAIMLADAKVMDFLKNLKSLTRLGEDVYGKDWKGSQRNKEELVIQIMKSVLIIIREKRREKEQKAEKSSIVLISALEVFAYIIGFVNLGLLFLTSKATEGYIFLFAILASRVIEYFVVAAVDECDPITIFEIFSGARILTDAHRIITHGSAARADGSSLSFGHTTALRRAISTLVQSTPQMVTNMYIIFSTLEHDGAIDGLFWVQVIFVFATCAFAGIAFGTFNHDLNSEFLFEKYFLSMSRYLPDNKVSQQNIFIFSVIWNMTHYLIVCMGLAAVITKVSVPLFLTGLGIFLLMVNIIRIVSNGGEVRFYARTESSKTSLFLTVAGVMVSCVLGSALMPVPLLRYPNVLGSTAFGFSWITAASLSIGFTFACVNVTNVHLFSGFIIFIYLSVVIVFFVNIRATTWITFFVSFQNWKETLRNELWFDFHAGSSVWNNVELLGDEDAHYAGLVKLYLSSDLPWTKLGEWLMQRKPSFEADPPLWLSEKWLSLIPLKVRKELWSPEEFKELVDVLNGHRSFSSPSKDTNTLQSTKQHEDILQIASLEKSKYSETTHTEVAPNDAHGHQNEDKEAHENINHNVQKRRSSIQELIREFIPEKVETQLALPSNITLQQLIRKAEAMTMREMIHEVETSQTSKSLMNLTNTQPDNDIMASIFGTMLKHLHEQNEEEKEKENVTRILVAGFFEVADEVSDIILAIIFLLEAESLQWAAILMFVFMGLNRSLGAFISFTLGEFPSRVLEGLIGVKAITDTYRMVTQGQNAASGSNGMWISVIRIYYLAIGLACESLPQMVLQLTIVLGQMKEGSFNQDVLAAQLVSVLASCLSVGLSFASIAVDNAKSLRDRHESGTRRVDLPWDKIESWLIDKKQDFLDSPPLWMTPGWFDYLPASVKQAVWKEPGEFDILLNKVKLVCDNRTQANEN